MSHSHHEEVSHALLKTNSSKKSTANSQARSKTTRNILIAFLLNLSFSIYEFIGGTITGSTAIMSDAIHDLGDALSIGVSFFLEKKSVHRPDQTYTYGYLRYSLVGGMFTTLILLLGSIFVIINAIYHLVHPVSINYDGMIALALVGTVINFCAAYLTREGDSLNQKSVNPHMLEDVLGWLIVLIGAIIMKFVDITYIDPILSIFVAIFILKNALQNFFSILDVFLEKAPSGISLAELQNHLQQLPHVQNVHHIHVWSIDGFHNYATLHIVTTTPSPKLKQIIRTNLAKHNITHTTIEFESPEETCLETKCHISAISIPQQAHHHHH